MSRFHANQVVLTLTGVDQVTVVAATVDREVVEIDSSRQGLDIELTSAGLLRYTFNLTCFIPPAVALPTPGTVGAMTLVYQDDSTDGSYAGDVIVTRCSDRYQLNSNAAIDITLRPTEDGPSVDGAIALTTPA
jgi:hypothetical protein